MSLNTPAGVPVVMTREELIGHLESWHAEDPEAFVQHAVTGESYSFQEIANQVRDQRGLGEELYQGIREDVRRRLN
jgi:hypothetical protein